MEAEAHARAEAILKAERAQLFELQREVIEEKKKLELMLEKIEKQAQAANNKIKLNVGGQIFIFLKETLLRDPNTFFYAMLGSDRWQPDEDGEYFIDRDPRFFSRIGYFLRNGEWDLSSMTEDEKRLFRIELDFYQITPPDAESDHLSFTYVSDFDENGILYWLGTAQNTKPFSNPCNKDQLIRSTESDMTYGSGRKAFGRKSKPNYVDNGWFQIEFKTISITPTHYTLRTDTRNNYSPRNWVLEGSRDGHTWITLSSHVNDTSVGPTPSSHASWPITCPSAQNIKLLRLTITGKNSRGNRLFMVCGFEVYGTVTLNK
eukprot:TRINITY_DN11323_c0_g1_i1.p1 TRINITY_DN11323_c0_g1~~TRINITY_DN11323_c0_g1_i1.p1  ORF type:complete len:364 (+),score=42.41 TRINITY_DN11323_c0_g1_i1:141-1094(+)